MIRGGDRISVSPTARTKIPFSKQFCHGAGPLTRSVRGSFISTAPSSPRLRISRTRRRRPDVVNGGFPCPGDARDFLEDAFLLIDIQGGNRGGEQRVPITYTPSSSLTSLTMTTPSQPRYPPIPIPPDLPPSPHQPIPSPPPPFDDDGCDRRGVHRGQDLPAHLQFDAVLGLALAERISREIMSVRKV